MNDFVRSMPWGTGLRRDRRSYRLHLDPYLVVPLLLIAGFGLIVLYGSVRNGETLYVPQLVRIGLAFGAMLVAAQLHPRFYVRWAPVIYGAGIILLVAVLLAGVAVNNSQRWLEIPGLPRFQPSELMKIAVPLMVAWYFRDRPLPPKFRDLVVALIIVIIPAALVIRQPDLGTGLLLVAGGLAVIVLAGIYWRWIGLALAAGAAMMPLGWQFLLHDYQRQRILTLFDPESDPLGSGWNTIQATTAIGSGGVFGKGLGQGTQSQLDFLPESHTDFIIAVIGEELGFVGVTLLLLLYLAVLARCLYAATQSQDTFGRLVSGGLALVFFVYVFVNIAMVCGLLPVVGVPLPLVSYGGTSAITILAGFGIVMSIFTHRSWR